MNRLRRLIISSAAVLLFSGVALTVPVSAINSGTDDSSLGSAQSGATLTDNLRLAGKQKAEQARQNHNEQSEAQRQKVCQARSKSLDHRMATAVKVASQHKTNIDRIYEKVKAFHDSKQLDISNYNDLTAAVDTEADRAQVAIDALQNLDVSVDCASRTVADSVASFREAVSSTRDSLKAYRQALVDLITSLKGASTSTSNSTDNTTGQ